MFSTRLEGIAQDLLDQSLCGESLPVDAFELAACCGLEVAYSDVRDALLYDETIYVSRRVSIRRLHLAIAHEIGHWALRRDGMPDSESDADYLAGALLVPRRQLLHSLRRGWDLDALREEHVHAPASIIAERIARLRDGTAAIYDGDKLRRRIGPAYQDELSLRTRAIVAREPVRVDDCTGAWPVIVGSWRRVIVLAASAPA